MSNIILQTPIITESADPTPIKTVTLVFKLGSTAVDSFDLNIEFDPAVLNASTLAVKGASGWTFLDNLVSPTNLLVSGYSLTALPAGATAVELSIQLQPGADTSIVIGYSGGYNDPQVDLPFAQFSFVVGTAGDDVLAGTSGNDLIQGLAGQDSIDGTGPGTTSGNDILSGGSGLDRFTLGAGTTQITDPEFGETFQVSGAAFTGDDVYVEDGFYDSGVSVSAGSGPLQGQVHWSNGGGVTTLQIGLDSIAGADATLVLNGNFAQADLQAVGDTILLNHRPGGSLTISGEATEGATLTRVDALTDADGISGRTYQWYADEVAIAGATGTSLVLSQSEVGKTISVGASYTDGNGLREFVESVATAAVANVDDEATGVLSVAGTAQEGGTLVASLTGVSDEDGATTTAYQWQENTGTAEAPVWVNIEGATSATLSLPDDQSAVGKIGRVLVTTTDVLGGTTTFASTPGTVANVNDLPTGSVSISGTVLQGQTLTASSTVADDDGIPASGPNAARFQWKADGNAISGATSSSYTLTQAEVGKVITATVSYTDDQGTPESVSSSATAAVININDAPAGAVVIDGSPSRGQTLSANLDALSDADGIPASGPNAPSYQWKADGSPISGATSASLVLTDAELDKQISVTVSYTDLQGAAESVTSALTNSVTINIPATGSVTVSGTATQGETLTAANTLADGDGLGTISYQWKATSGGVTTAISGATASTYTLTQAEVGKTVSVEASFTDGNGTLERKSSSASATVANVNDAPVGSLAIDGTATQGQTLSANSSGVSDADGIPASGPNAPSYQWKADGTAITGATSSNYTLTQADVGKAISVTATYTDEQGTPETLTSSATAAVANVNDAPTGSVSISGTATQGQTLTASNTLADIDGIAASGTNAIRYQWKADGTAISGATSSSYTLTQAEVGKAISVTASYTDEQGSAEAVTSSATAGVANVNDAPTGGVSISGTATQGQTLTASNTLADVDGIPASGPNAPSFQWKADGNAISGATSSSYTLTQAEVGKTITVTAAYTDEQGTPESLTSSATAAVANVNDAPTGSVSISGTAEQYQTLTASNTLADIDGIPGAGQPGAISYRWRANGVDIVGATNATYALTQAEVAKSITVQAIYTDQQGTVETVESTATSAVIDINDAPTGVALNNLRGTLLEDTDVSARIKLADVVAIDDTVGTNQLSLSGVDADRFELDGTALFFKASAQPLDFETVSGYSVQISAADAAFAETLPVSLDLRLLVGNVVEAEPAPTPPSYLGLENQPDQTEGEAAYEAWLERIEESVPVLNIAGAVEGDGNGDGVPDDTQAAVASRPFVVSSNASEAPADAPQVFVTLVAESTEGKASDSSAALSNIRQEDAPADLPEDIVLPLGILSFDAAVSEVGKTETFSLYVNADLGVTGYWKQDASNTWVNLASAPYGGDITLEGGRLRLDFQITDGGAFDNDGLANGVIVDPGALGVVELSLAGAIPVVPAGVVWF